MKYTARRMASRLANSPKWQAVPGGLLALRALRDAGEAAFPLRKPDKVYGKIGSLEVRLTRRRRDVKLAQRLRYKVFYEEMRPSPLCGLSCAAATKIPTTPFAITCLSSMRQRSPPTIHGAGCADTRLSGPTAFCVRKSPSARSASTRRANTTSRRSSRPSRAIGSWSSALVRARAVPQQADSRASLARAVDVCARAQGRCDDRLRESARHRRRPARHGAELPASQRAGAGRVALRAHERLYVGMDLLPKDKVDVKVALRALPPLIKGYLRLGAFVATARHRRAVRHHRRAHHPARREDRPALFRAFRHAERSEEPDRRRRLIRRFLPRVAPDGPKGSGAIDRRELQRHCFTARLIPLARTGG